MRYKEDNEEYEKRDEGMCPDKITVWRGKINLEERESTLFLTELVQSKLGPKVVASSFFLFTLKRRGVNRVVSCGIRSTMFCVHSWKVAHKLRSFLFR